uniref:Uncharacterized protein n=1 Tax=Oryza barthii TaxID=65489 RepID=A0A0D3GFR0_9ORYZ
MASPGDQRWHPLLRQPPPRLSPPRLPVSIAALASSASNLAPPPIAARRLHQRRPPSSPSTVAAHGASKPSPHAQLIPVAHDHAAHLSSIAASTSHLMSISSAPPAIPRRGTLANVTNLTAAEGLEVKVIDESIQLRLWEFDMTVFKFVKPKFLFKRSE